MSNISWSFIVNGGGGFDYLLGKSGFAAFVQEYYINIPYAFFIIFYTLSVLGFFYTCYFVFINLKKHFKGGTIGIREKMLTLFLIIYFSIQLIYFVSSIPGYPHYNIVFYPMIIIFFVFFLEYVNDKIPRFKWIIDTIVMVIVVSNIYFIFSFYSFINCKHGLINGDYGKPYRYTQDKWDNTYLKKNIIK